MPRGSATNGRVVSGTTAHYVEGPTECPFVLRASPESRRSLVPVAGTSLGKGPSPVKVTVLKSLLARYLVLQDRGYLSDGFELGFRIPFQGARHPFLAKNLKSVQGKEALVKEKINKEVREGRVAGPFEAPPFPALRVSPLGIVPKKTPGEHRLIHHLSYPKGDSVNDAIPELLCSVRYTSFDQAVQMVKRCGPGAEMAKCDIKSAFRLLPVHPEDFDLLGFMFEGVAHGVFYLLCSL